MTIDAIQRRLASYRPVLVDAPGDAHAAVAIVLREGGGGPEFIVIHRAHRRGDPWSGHMALPGGREQPGDDTLFATAARETREEVGVDLDRDGRLLGHLDDLRAIGRGRPLDLIIRPFVCALHAPVTVTPNLREVQRAFWVPLASLRHHDARGVYRQTRNGQELELPAFVYAGHTIWGLTHRILTGFLDAVDSESAPNAR